ncbi:hypothetical protein [Pseudomonas sp. NLJ1]|uniref:hypothetical protein n=1 Tax=Pseudomonas sp. NLJ1 TaxID=3086079 RepID=UPI003C6CBD48
MNMKLVLVPAVIAMALAGCGDDKTIASLPVEKTNRCALDKVQGSTERVVKVRPGIVELQGWALGAESAQGVSNLIITLKNAEGQVYTFEEGARYDRPDVAKAFKNDGYKSSGFIVKADLSNLPAGAYGILIRTPEKDRMMACAVNKNIIVEL